MSQRNPRILLVIGLTTVFAGCKPKPADPSAEKPEPPVFTVETTMAVTREVEDTVTAQGTIVAPQGASTRITAVTAGRIQEIRVREGDQVSAGQEVVLIDYSPQAAMSRSAAAAVGASERTANEADLAVKAADVDQRNAVKVADAALEAAQVDRENGVKLAKTGLLSAQTDLEKTKNGARPQEIAQADQAVNQAKVTRDRAAIEVDRSKRLYVSGFIAKNQLENAETALQVADAALESARQQANLVKAGAREEDVRAAQLRVQQAKETLTQAQTSGAARISQARAALKQAEQSALQVEVKREDARAMHAAVIQKRADLDSAKATAGFSVIRSPVAGIVVKRTQNPGDMADPLTPFLEIANISTVNLAASLPSDDAAKISVGMGVKITSPDMPSKPFRGKVVSVGQVDPNTNLQTVRVEISNANFTLKLGSYAEASILCGGKRQGITVPKTAVLSRDDKTSIYVAGADGLAHQREISAGIETDDYVEITKGLKAGEKVISSGQYTISDGAKIKLAEPKTTEKADDKPGPEKK